MSGFAYERPATLAEAIRSLVGSTGGVHALAGGTDLVLQRAAGDLTGDRLVDLKDLDELRGIAVQDGSVRIGAATPLHAFVQLRGLGVDALEEGAAIVGSSQTRRRATLGGNICRASPAGDTLPALLVLDGEFTLVSQEGERSVPAAAFFTGPGQTVRRPDELLTAIRVAAWPGSAYARLTYRQWMDLAVVGVAAGIRLDNGVVACARVALGGAAPTPLLVTEAAALLEGTRPTDAATEAAAHAVVAAAQPIDDVRGSAWYRRAALAPLARQVIRRATERAAAATARPTTSERGA